MKHQSDANAARCWQSSMKISSWKLIGHTSAVA